MKKYMSIVLAMAIGLTAVGCGKEEPATPETPAGTPTGTPTEASAILQLESPEAGEEIAVITTSLGEMKVRFYPEEAPLAVENFIGLAKDGYYDGLIYHRVIDNFMIQTGDPTGTGTGGESFTGKDFEDEISPNLHFYRGAVAMANKGPNTNGSQFFVVQNPKVNQAALDTIREATTGNEELGITLKDKFYSIQELYTEDVLTHFEENGGAIELEYIFGAPYTIFGQVFEGLDVVDAIAAVKTDEQDKPLESVTIEKVEIVAYEPKA